MKTVSIDLGGTHCRAAVVDHDGTIVQRTQRLTPVSDPSPLFLADMAREVAEKAGSGVAAEGVVVGVPGIVDHEAERLLLAPNLPASWIPLLNEEWLAHHAGLPVSMANDADLAAVGEATFGAGKDHRDVSYMTISTGIGAGSVVGGRLVRGSRSGSEVGHLIIDRVAAARGEAATVEDHGSGTAIARRAAQYGYPESGSAFADLVRSGDEGAVDIWTEAIESAGLGVVALAWMVLPSMIVIGGGVGRNEDIVQPILARQLKRFGPMGGDGIELATAALGDDAALAGGAAWWVAIGRG